MPLASRATIKSDWLNIPAIDTSKDAMIDRLISYADAEIQDICQQPIAQQSKTIYFAGNLDVLYNTFYTVPVTMSALASRSSYSDTFTAVLGTTSIVITENGNCIYNSNVFTDMQYQATLQVGYATVPSIVELCAIELVVEMYNSTPFASQMNRFGVSATIEAEAGMTINKTLTRMRPRIRERLLPYTRLMI